MKTAPSEELQGVAEEIVEVDVDEKEVKTPNKLQFPRLLLSCRHNKGCYGGCRVYWNVDKSKEKCVSKDFFCMEGNKNLHASSCEDSNYT